MARALRYPVTPDLTGLRRDVSDELGDADVEVTARIDGAPHIAITDRIEVAGAAVVSMRATIPYSIGQGNGPARNVVNLEARGIDVRFAARLSLETESTRLIGRLAETSCSVPVTLHVGRQGIEFELRLGARVTERTLKATFPVLDTADLRPRLPGLGRAVYVTPLEPKVSTGQVEVGLDVRLDGEE